MTVMSQTGAARLLLPLVAGVLAAGLGEVLPAPAAFVVHGVLPLTLGALLPSHPWRSGVLFAAPALCVMVARAGAASAGLVAFVVVTSPVVVLIAGLLVKGGAVLFPRGGHGADRDGPTVERRGGPRRGLFETKAQRGRFLVVLALVLVAAAAGIDNWGAAEADRMAARRAEEISDALAGASPADLRPRLLGAAYGGLGERPPGGPYTWLRPGTDELRAAAEVRHRLQVRCIEVRLDAAGRVSTEISGGRC